MRTKTKIWIVALAGVGAIMTVGAMAQDAGADARTARLAKFLEAHQEADADDDGVLTIEEFRAYRQSKGGKGGKGAGLRQGRGEPRGMGMGRPTPEEILAKHPEADVDGDNTLSPEELRAFGMQMRAQHMLAMHPDLDADGDGMLSEEEMKAAPMAGRHGKGPGGPMGPGGPRGPMGPRPNPMDIVLNHFGAIDTDNSGALSREEIEAFKETMPEPPCGPGMGDGPKGPNGECVVSPEAKGKGKGQARRGLRGGSPSPEMRAKILERHPAADANGDGQLSDEELSAVKAQRGGKRGGQGKGAGAGQ